MLAVAAEVSRRRAAEAESRSLNDASQKVIAREQTARRDAEDANRVMSASATLSHELRIAAQRGPRLVARPARFGPWPMTTASSARNAGD